MPAKRVYTSIEIAYMNIDFIKEQAILKLENLICEAHPNYDLKENYGVRIIISRQPEEVEITEVTKKFGFFKRRKIVKEIQSHLIADFVIPCRGKIVAIKGNTIEKKMVIEFLESISNAWYTENCKRIPINIEYAW